MRNILTYTIGDKTHGMGHVMRQLTLARALAALDVRVTFRTLVGTAGFDRIRQSTFSFQGDMDELAARNMTNPFRLYSALIIDIEHGPDEELLRSARPYFKTIVNVGGVGWAQKDPAALDTLVDLQIYQGELFDYPTASRKLNGPRYLIIDPAFADCEPDLKSGPIVISMGGSDPHGLTRPAYDALTGYSRRVIIGPATQAEPPAASIVSPPSLVPYLNGARLFVGQTGMTAYEAMAAGVPCLLIDLSIDHSRTSKELERRGAVWNLGMWDKFNGLDLSERVRHLITHPAELKRMSECGRELVDGLGAARVAEAICQLI